MVCSCPETLKSWALNSTYSCTVKSCDQAWSKQTLLDRIVLVSVGSVRQTHCRSDGDGSFLCCWAIRGVLTSSRRFVSRALVFLVHFVNLVLFDYKILLTVPLMSLDHVWIVTNAGNLVSCQRTSGNDSYCQCGGGVCVLGVTPLTLWSCCCGALPVDLTPLFLLVVFISDCYCRPHWVCQLLNSIFSASGAWTRQIIWD